MRVSIIIPAYNARQFVCRALSSVKAQTKPPFEVIVSDDGSVDGTADEVRRWSEETGFRVLIVSGANGGIGAARNRALAVASGDVIALLDADDEMLPRQIEALVEGFHLFSDAALVCGDVSTQFDSGNRVESHTAQLLADFTVSVEPYPWKRFIDPFRACLRGNRIPNQCTFIKKSVLEASGGWDSAFRAVEDRELFLRLSNCGGFYFYPETLATKHEREESVSRNRYLMSAYQFRVLCKARVQHRVNAEVDMTINESACEYLYHASLRGFSAFRAAQEEIRNARVKVSPKINIKAWCRALKAEVQG